MLRLFENIVSQVGDDAIAGAAEERSSDSAEQILNYVCSEQERNDYIERLPVFTRDDIVDEHLRDIRRHKAQRRYYHGHDDRYADDFKLGSDIFYKF